VDIGFLTRQAGWSATRVDPNHPAISFEAQETVTYGRLHKRVNSYANHLLSLGVAPGDRVAILLYNCIEYWLVYLGVARIGAIAVRLNFRLAAEELQYAICDSGSTVLCADSSLLDRLEPNLAHLPVRRYVCRTSKGEVPATWAESWAGFEKAPDAEPQVPNPDLNDPAMLMYTSGTTGRPKGALWTHGNTCWFAAMQALQWRFTAATTVMVTGPLYHVGGIENLSSPALAMGGHVVLLSSTGFDIARTLRIAGHHQVTDILLFPYMIYELLTLPNRAELDLSSIRRIITGGDPILPAASEQLLSAYPWIDLVQAYGLTEGTPIAACGRPGDIRVHPESVGVPVPFTEISIRRDDGSVLAQGSAGEVWTRSPAVAREYWGNPEATAQTFVDGWCRTGDIGLVNEDGLLVISGRKKDMIRSGGENIYPAELEDVLMRHPAIKEAAVIGVAHARLSETVCAVVVPIAGAQVSETEVIEHCVAHLASYKKPRYIVFTDALPRTASGKVIKQVLREHYQGLGKNG